MTVCGGWYAQRVRKWDAKEDAGVALSSGEKRANLAHFSILVAFPEAESRN